MAGAMPGLRGLLPLLLAALLAAATTSHAHNITKILAEHPEFTTFNHYLSATHLATEINRRLTITVLAVDNSAMSSILSKGLSIYTIKHVLSLHILADYFGTRKLHQLSHRSTVVASFFQATGAAPGTTGYVNITNFKGGRIAIGAKDNTGNEPGTILDASFIKSIKEIPYNISVIQISKLLSSPEAEAPAAAPNSYNITLLMIKKGCRLFASLAANTTDVEKAMEVNLEGGLTVFCPIDAAMNRFMPKYNNLTAEGKAALLSYHVAPIYNSIQDLKQNTGLMTTLATDSSGTGKGYSFTVGGAGKDGVEIKTKIITASLTTTIIDENPLAIYAVDKVLEPTELFKVPEPVAPAPKGAKGKGIAVDGSTAEADSPEGDTADQKAADQNGSKRVSANRWVAVAATAAVAASLVVGF